MCILYKHCNEELLVVLLPWAGLRVSMPGATFFSQFLPSKLFPLLKLFLFQLINILRYQLIWKHGFIYSRLCSVYVLAYFSLICSSSPDWIVDTIIYGFYCLEFVVSYFFSPSAIGPWRAKLILLLFLIDMLAYFRLTFLKGQSCTCWVVSTDHFILQYGAFLLFCSTTKWGAILSF
jgi:hypothetical protein